MQTLDEKLAQAAGQMDRVRDLRASLPSAREKLTEQTHLVNRLEACLEGVMRKLAELESFSLGGLLASMVGGKEKKIDDFRAQVAEYETQFTSAAQQLASLEQKVSEIEDELAQLGDPAKALSDLRDEKAASILARGDARADELRRLSDEWNNARAVSAKIEKSAEAGRQLLKHLESLDRAVRNAKGNRRLSGGGAGVVGKIITNAVAGMGPKSVLRFVHDGVRRFNAEVGEIPVTDHPDEQDLMRIRAELQAFGERLSVEMSGLTSWDQIATLPVEQDVRAALHHLKSMSANLKPTLDALDQQRAALIDAD